MWKSGAWALMIKGAGTKNWGMNIFGVFEQHQEDQWSEVKLEQREKKSNGQWKGNQGKSRMNNHNDLGCYFKCNGKLSECCEQ